MRLRDVTEDDLPIFFEHQRDPDASRMAAMPSRERDAFLLHWRTNVLGNASPKKTIVVEGAVAGNVVSWESGESGGKERKRLVGYWIGAAYWGRGVATAALAEFVAEHERTRPLYAYVAVPNVGSIRVLEKCGFGRVGDVVVGSDGVKELLLRLDRP